ncbi:MAG: TRC40/GET3/ArsA family transport-energizing ATPase [Desulfobacteraceae bacterium]|nr:TRC40/GET3/ArsA family transport-energizing ATPase [Desulfobacteraceae bacterium]
MPKTVALSFLHDHDLRLLLFGGKGGVGKTTCAAATALYYARHQPQQRFLLVSTDPAHSLNDSLGDFSPPENLTTLEFDARACLTDFKNAHLSKLREIASRGTFLDDEDINQLMDLSLPGLDELMAFLEISQWAEEGQYQCIVVDSAPTGHTLRLLAMPEFMGNWLDALDALLAKHRYMKKQFTGTYKQDELDDFLLGLKNSVNRMKVLLADPVRCRFVSVMLAEALSIHETRMLLDELNRLQIASDDIIVNRIYPESDCPLCSNRHRRQVAEIVNFAAGMAQHALAAIPMYPQEMRGEAALQQFWDHTFALPESVAAAANAQSGTRPEVMHPAPLPGADVKLLMFAGKGGVGKTTLACASAVRMAQALDGKEILLFSTDPAHSLSACLEKSVNASPTPLMPGLSAMEIDAGAEFEALKQQYAEELAHFLSNLSSSLDLTFDREVMERVMDLSPPGVDEVMALTMVMEFLDQDRFDLLILDSAPTGHLVRLLETPEIIDQWLKVFFNLFLKYKRIFRLPEISQRMVKISKTLKLLNKILIDTDASALFGVTILTEMALLETRDLLAACERMHIQVPSLFLNMATPPGDCRLCSSLQRMEKKLIHKYRDVFPDQSQPLVYQAGDLGGIERLGQLGKALYQ